MGNEFDIMTILSALVEDKINEKNISNSMSEIRQLGDGMILFNVNWPPVIMGRI